jgi:hypothetical protein
MVKIKNPELKVLIMDIINFTDDVNEDGQKILRQSYNKKYFKGVKEIKSKLLSSVEVLVTIEDNGNTKDVWMPFNEAKDKPYFQSRKAERFTDDEIVLSDAAVNALKFYADEREEYLDVSEETYQELEKICYQDGNK